MNLPQLSAVNDAATTTIGTAITVNVLANDAGTGLSVTQVGAPSHGSAVLNNNAITDRPETGFAGTYAFAYAITDAFNRTVTATVTVTIAAPALTAANDTATASPGAAVTIDVLANDTGVGLTVTQVSTPSHGIATLSGNIISYRPNADFTGTDVFTYTITDGASTATSTVTVTVKPGQQEILPGITDNPNAKSVGGAIGNSCSDPAASAEFVRDCTALISAASSNDPGWRCSRSPRKQSVRRWTSRKAVRRARLQASTPACFRCAAESGSRESIWIGCD